MLFLKHICAQRAMMYVIGWEKGIPGFAPALSQSQPLMQKAMLTLPIL